MESEDGAPAVEPNTTTDGPTPESRAVPKIGLVRDNHVEAEPVPAESSQGESVPGIRVSENPDPTDNVVLLKSRRSGGYLPLLTVCLAAVASLALLLVDFRLGAACLAGSVGLALFFRAVLSDKRAGLLVVRSRVFDLWFLTVLALALALLAVVVPAPPK